ncbi:hypothetical protein [Anaerotignum sp.]
MREKRRWQNTWLREIAMQQGMRIGSEITIRERSLLKDYSYITRQIRHGVVLEMYPYHFYCRMSDGTKESFRYNEFLGYEARLIRLKEKKGASMKFFKKEPVHETAA